MHTVELLSSILTFAGAALLAGDALFVERRIRAESGARRYQQALKSKNAANVLKDEKGNPLHSETALSLWLARETLHWNWCGFVLMAIGFVLDFVSKWKH